MTMADTKKEATGQEPSTQADKKAAAASQEPETKQAAPGSQASETKPLADLLTSILNDVQRQVQNKH
jgi:hypothetical protein